MNKNEKLILQIIKTKMKKMIEELQDYIKTIEILDKNKIK